MYVDYDNHDYYERQKGMKDMKKGNRIAVVFVVLMFIFGLLGLCHSCRSKENKVQILAGTMTFENHDYVVFFHPDWKTINVVHSEDCRCYVLPPDSN